MTPLDTEEQSNKERWKDRQKLKTAITVSIPIIILLIIIFLAVFLKSEKGFCDTDPYIQQTNKLKRGMNLDINPCDNFYKFVCGNALKDSSRKNLFVELNEKVDQDLLELYKEDIKDNEHKMVKIAKELFKKCMDAEDIEKDGLSSIKDVINKVGGWPVLDNGNKSFDWVQATYKLRELGYPFSFFVNVYVKRARENKEKFYLKITILDELDEDKSMRKYSHSEATGMMAKVAKLFGAKNEDLAEREMSEAYEFWQQLPYDQYRSEETYTVEQFQTEYDKQGGISFKWLEFLNTVVGPQIIVSPNDYISAQDPHAVSDWIKLLSTTSERTVENWMIWKVIQTQLPYLPKSVQNIMKYSTNNTREEFCLKETNKRFIVSPIEVINTRNLLSAENRQEVQKIFSEIKSEFLNLIEQSNWMDEKDKRILTEKIKKLTLIYGLPGDYLNDRMVDDMDVDLVERKTNTFLGYLAQVNRNLQTVIYKRITLPSTSNTMSRMYLKNKHFFPIYFSKAVNEYFVPTEFVYYLQNGIPRYFKYSLIGSIFGSFFLASMSRYDPEFKWVEEEIPQQTTDSIENLAKCLQDQMQKYNLSNENLDVMSIMSVTIGEKVSYIAYEKWIQSNGEEQLPGSNYTSRQVFWIAGTNCHVPPNLHTHDPFNDMDIYSNFNLVSKLNNPYFAKDFNCPVGSETNSIVKCPLIL